MYTSVISAAMFAALLIQNAQELQVGQLRQPQEAAFAKLVERENTKGFSPEQTSQRASDPSYIITITGNYSAYTESIYLRD